MIKKLLIFIICIMGIGYAVWNNDSFQRSYIYPYPYRQTIEEYADRYQIDANLVAGVAMTESKFDPKVQSSHGAVGIMQLMPDTATWIAKKIEDDNFTVDKLQDPKTNIKYGTWYLAELTKEFRNNPILILAAYNAGRGNVHQWMEENNWDMDFSDIDKIPFPETKEYVKRAMENSYEYKRLYPRN